MIQYIVGILVILLLFWELKKNNKKIEVAKMLYLHSWKNVGLAILSIMFVGTTSILLHDYVPNWMNWGWTSLFSDSPTNIVTTPIKVIEESPLILGIDLRYVGIIGFWLLLVVLLPSFALIEETLFRYEVHDWKTIIIRSFVFGFLHMIMGISIFIALILSIVGFFFHLRYKSTYNYYIKLGMNEMDSNDIALESTASYHVIYNFIIVTLLTVIYMMTFYYDI